MPVALIFGNTHLIIRIKNVEILLISLEIYLLCSLRLYAVASNDILLNGTKIEQDNLMEMLFGRC